jgi:predicted  nucleic acid-binding Zn-ribbon protein
MATQASWQKIRNEFTRLTDVEQLKSEVHRIGNEIRKFDFHTVLSPSAQAKVKMFERRYAELMRTMQQAQRQVDREFNKILRQIKTRRGVVYKVVDEQKSKLDDIRKRFTAGSAKMKKTTAKRATARKTTATKKRRK